MGAGQGDGIGRPLRLQLDPAMDQLRSVPIKHGSLSQQPRHQLALLLQAQTDTLVYEIHDDYLVH